MGKDGVIALAGASQGRRRIIAAVGASVALATAACQTVPPEERPNRFEISGTTSYPYLAYTLQLRSSDGRRWTMDRAPGSAEFSFQNLYPGVYELSASTSCGNREVMRTITLRDSSIRLENVHPEEECIIVGVMLPAHRRHQG